jgi:pyruvate dehydrogenase E1 component alpha subunit
MPRKTIADFTVEYLQILDEEGKVDKKLEPKLSDDDLLRLHRGMVRARELDDRMLKLQRQGRIGTFPPNIGQEAVSTAAALAMAKDDWFVSSFRELGGRLLRGEPLTAPLLYYNGWEEGNVLPPEVARRMLPLAVVVGSQIPQAAGLGYAIKLRGEPSAVVCFMGDGATSEGDFYEGLNFAAAWQAPVVFISQNNQWAISVPRSQQTHAATLAQKGIAAGMPCLQLDGNDPLACYAGVKEALDRARGGGGPTMIEAVTYRLSMHTTADDPRKYRDEAEEQLWWAKEPLLRYRMYLAAKGIWDDARDEALVQEIRAEVDTAVKAFEAMTAFPADRPFDHVYAQPDPYIERQRREYLASVKEEAGDA